MVTATAGSGTVALPGAGVARQLRDHGRRLGNRQGQERQADAMDRTARSANDVRHVCVARSCPVRRREELERLVGGADFLAEGGPELLREPTQQLDLTAPRRIAGVISSTGSARESA